MRLSQKGDASYFTSVFDVLQFSHRLDMSNNIFKNLSFFAVTLYGNGSPTPTSGHTITDNKIQDLGTYDVGSGINFWGGGVLLYNNQYAAVSNNCMTNVRIGVQTGNFSQANPGVAAYQVISGNTITARRRGIFHNLFYSTASAFTFNSIPFRSFICIGNKWARRE